MRKLHRLILLLFVPLLLPLAFADSAPVLSEDAQWIDGLTASMEYITDDAYQKHGGASANNAYWTRLSGGQRPDGSKYGKFRLVEGHRLAVLSAWYGQDIHFRVQGTSGAGTVIKIPDYSQLKEPYKRAIRVLNAYSPDTGDSFYAAYIRAISDSNGYLESIVPKVNIDVTITSIITFNKAPDSYLTDAEGSYIYDLVAVGANTSSEIPDLSGKAAWALKRYIQDGYGFLIGHDSIYGYGGVHENPDYTPDPNSTDTPIYQLDTNINGTWNINWLMGVNRLYTEASPYDAASMILNIGDWRDKSTLYGNTSSDELESKLRISAPAGASDPQTDPNARNPINYPYSSSWQGADFTQGMMFTAGATHSNQQIAYGKTWITFVPEYSKGTLVEDRNEGLQGSNNFYLTTNGNIGMIQVGHIQENLSQTRLDECRILANTILYLSQREPCGVCQSRQGGNDTVHAVTRIASVEELAKIGDPAHAHWYPLDGCQRFNFHAAGRIYRY